MRLLNFVPEPLPTHRADVTALFGRYLPALGIHSHLIGMPGQGELSTEGFTSLKTSSAAGGRLRREWAYISLCLRTMLFTAKADFDVIQVRDMVPIGLLGLCIARLRGKPFVYWMSYLMSEERIQRATVKIERGLPFKGCVREHLVLLKGRVESWLLYRVLLQQANHVFVQSDAMLVHVMQRGIQAERLSPVPMGVDMVQLQSLDLLPVSYPACGSNPVIGYLGTLARARNIEHLVEVLARVRAVVPGTQLLLIGDSTDPSDAASIRSRAAACGLDRAVHITGWLPANAALPLLAGVSVAISFIPRDSILDTGSPTKLVEYLAIGMPCVGNDNPDQAKVLQDSGAGTLTDSSVVGLANALSGLLQDLPSAKARALAGPAYVHATRSYQRIATVVAANYSEFVCGK
jgi:glycosyltransferase involved in cell wall biosynthesis